MIEVGRRRKTQPAPPHVVREALLEPNRDPARQWLALGSDEDFPQTGSDDAGVVVWARWWGSRPDAVVRFELEPQGPGAGTVLTWILLVEPPEPDESLLGHLRKRVNQVINAELRYSFGQ